MSVTIVDRSAAVPARWDDASRRGLDAAANHLRTELLKAFGSDYYKGGRFRSTLQVKQSIRRLAPYKTRDGWETTIGTNKIEALYWELGHQNTFTRKYERVQLWVPTAADNVEPMRATYARVVARLMGTA